MTWDVGEGEIFRTDKLDWWALEHGVVFFTDKSGVLDGFLDDVVYILLGECVRRSTVS